MLLAKSVASDLNDTITFKKLNGTIHSVFDYACNIQVSHDNLVTLISPRLSHYPNTIKLDIEENRKLSSIGFKVGMKATINKTEISIPDIYTSIRIAKAKIWDSSPLFLNPVISEKILRKNLEKVKDLTLRYGRRGGATSLLGKSEVDNNYVDFIINPVKKLITGIKNYNCKEITEASRRLIGFGPGLTPAADDFLLGVMAAIYYIGNYYSNKFENLQKITKAMISVLPGRTTLVSEMMLKNGMMARFPESLRELMLAITGGTFITDKCLALLNIGGTSGSDWAAGVVFGGLVMMDIKKMKEGEENVRKISY